VDQVASAIENAQLNSARNGVRNIRFEAGSVEKWIKHGEKPAFTSVVVDPPRGGLSSKVIEFLKKNPCRKLLYISCNPATLARDLADLADAYRVRRIRPVDMFPQTYHVETVVLLEP
jgi:23S rRNA (uracil1939-C5)-methyltransferase